MYDVIKGRLPWHKDNMFELETSVLIGWLGNTLRETVNQNAKLKVKNFCFNV